MKMSAMDTGQQCTQLTQLKQHKTLLSSHSSSKWPHRTFGGLEWTTAIYSIVIFLLLSATVTSGQTPTISSNSDNNNFQEGTNISLSCFVSSMNVILNWSFPYNLSNYVIVNGIVQDVYWSNLTYNATALDNSRTLTCSSSSSYQSISINVILVPHQPIITGPDISNASVAYTWKCLSTGASLIPPNVYWRTGDGLALTDNVSKSTLITSKPNANFVYTITSTITVSLPPTSPEYKLVCSVVHFLYPYSVEKSDQKNITVLYPPQITTSNEPNVTINETQDVTLVCSIISNPSASQVIWYKDGNILDINSTRYSGGNISVPNLTIKSVSKSDAGNYTCSAVNQQGTSTSPNTTLIIKYVPEVTYNSTSYTGNAGGNLTIPCPVSAVPDVIEIIWQRIINSVVQTINVSSGTRFSGVNISTKQYDLTINPLQSDDIGIYYCTAKNIMGNVTGSHLSVTVIFDPYITVVNKTLTVTEGSNFTIDLAVHMYPPFDSIIWYKDNSQVPVGNQTKYQNGTVNSPSLSVLSAVPQDSGTYRIIARNSNSTVNETIAVDVLYTPKISTSPQTFNVTNNSSKIIPCEVQANPEVSSIRWQKLDLDSGQISSITIGGRFSGGNISNPSLTITGILPSDAAVYQCSAFNALGNTSGPYMTLRVFYKPEVTVSVNPSQISLDDKFELNCSAKSYPDVTGYLWYNGTTIISRTNSFVKNNATAYDYIQFRCSVSNSMGTTNAYITPNITFKPVQSDNGQETILATKPSSVTLECKVIANPAPSSYRWFNGTYEIAGATNYSLTILIDSDDDFTVYSCAATNIFGELNPARNFDIQQDIPKTGSSTGSSGLSTATIILIVIIAIILLIILILIVVFCCLQGVCQKCVKRKNVKVEPTNIKETSAAPSAASINNLLVSPKPVAPVAAGSPGLIISLPEKAGGPKPFYLPPLDPQAEAATEKFYRERKRRSRKKKKAKRSKEEEKNLTENGSDEGKTSPPPMTGRSDGTIANTSTA